jgi:hypothetical protein
MYSQVRLSQNFSSRGSIKSLVSFSPSKSTFPKQLNPRYPFFQGSFKSVLLIQQRSFSGSVFLRKDTNERHHEENKEQDVSGKESKGEKEKEKQEEESLHDEPPPRAIIFPLFF